MKLAYWGKFVEDNTQYEEHELDGGCSKLIVTLINDLDLLDGELCYWSRWTRWRKVDYIKALNEYLRYNVEKFDDFTITYKLVNIGCGSIKLPVYILDSLDKESKHNMVVVGEPGELNYILKDNMTLEECMRDNQGLVSFSMKSGEELMFMKNYISEKDIIRESYFPDSRVAVELYELRWILDDKDTINKTVCNASAFDDPECLIRYNLCEKIYVKETEKGVYEIDTRDSEGRPYKTDTRKGDSLYSVYYQYMVEKGYFNQKGNVKVKK